MVSDVIIVLIASVFYSFWLSSLGRQNKERFFLILIVLTVFHDFIFIHIGYYASETITYIVKSWQEYLVVFLVLITIARKDSRVNNKIFFLLSVLIVLSFWGTLSGIYQGTSIFEIFIGWRSYMLPILIGCLLLINRVFEGLEFKYVYKVIVVLALISVAGAFYQKILFSRHDFRNADPALENFLREREFILSDFWFFEKFGPLHMLRSWPNYIRGGSVRVTSFFVSPIAFAEFLVIPMVILLAKIHQTTSKMIKAKYLITLILLFSASYITNARIGILLAVLATVIFYLLSSVKVSSGILWVLIGGVLLSTFFSLIVLNVDNSAKGRLAQYIQMANSFNLYGYGFGSPYSDIYFDSMYISIVMLFGVGSLIYLGFHFYIAQAIYSKIRFVADIEQRVLAIISVTLALSFSFAFAFQYSIGPGTVPLLYLIFFLTLSQNMDFVLNHED